METSESLKCYDKYKPKQNPQRQSFINIPKRIWTYWNSGYESAPKIVREMIDSWKYYVPDYNITVVSDETLSLYLMDEKPEKLSELGDANRSDWIRLSLLKTYGGFWFDASMILTRDLNWAHEIARSHGSEGFGYSDGDDKIESFFLGTVPNSEFITAWFNEYDRAITCFGKDGMAYFEYIAEKYKNDVPDFREKILTLGIDLVDYLKVYVAAKKVLYIDRIEYFSRRDVFQYPFGAFHFEFNNFLPHVVTGPADLIPYVIKFNRFKRNELESHLKNGKVHDQSIYKRFVIDKISPN
jgi:hypothetical protein